MGLEKINLNIKVDFMNLKFSFQILKILRDFFLLDFFQVKCYGISNMRGGKNL
jgi:hypothetical protein